MGNHRGKGSHYSGQRREKREESGTEMDVCKPHPQQSVKQSLPHKVTVIRVSTTDTCSMPRIQSFPEPCLGCDLEQVGHCKQGQRCLAEPHKASDVEALNCDLFW